jgi:tetratricopeptide (TPR) repeat protein
MRTCFVSIPSGVRRDSRGRDLDFEFLYAEVIRPAVQELSIECKRLDEYLPGAVWHKTLFTALVSSDLVIADITTANPNVFYELGIRHALKRGRTVLISASGERLPANISFARALWYEPDEGGRVTGASAAKFRSELQAMLQSQTSRSSSGDSPIYEFFPDLEVTLPAELESSLRARRPRSFKVPPGFSQRVLESPAQARGELEKSEAEVRATPDADPAEYTTLMRQFRDLSEWDRVIALGDDAPPSVAQTAEVRQMLALALNRRRKPGDQDRAIALMEQQLAATGGDSETLGILGRIYKDRYDQSKAEDDPAGAAANLERALQYYRDAFEKNPRDYYPGINVLNLLRQRGDAAARAEMESILPRVRAAVQEKLETDRPSFWDLATDMQLAVVAHDWPRAEQAVQLALAQAPASWMLDTTLRDMREVGQGLTDANERTRFDGILNVLQSRDLRAESAG